MLGPSTGGSHVALLALSLCACLVFRFLLSNAGAPSASKGTTDADKKLTCTSSPKSQYDDGLSFIHVAKAGGTSLRAFFQSLAMECGYHAYIDGDYLDKFRNERDAKKSIDTAIKELT